MIRKVRNCCETCENLVCVATTIGQLQHTEYLKPTFLDTFKWAIRPVFPETVTYGDEQFGQIFQFLNVPKFYPTFFIIRTPSSVIDNKLSEC